MGAKSQIIKYMEETMGRTGIKVQWLKKPFRDLKNIDLQFRSKYLKYENLEEDMRSSVSKLRTNHIYFSTDIFKCNYVGFVLKDEKEVCIIGPVVFEQITEKNLQELAVFFNLSEEMKMSIFDYYSKIPLISSRNLFENIFISLGEKLYGEELEIVYDRLDEFYRYSEIISSKKITDEETQTLSDLEAIYQYNEMENELLLAVINGNEGEAINILKRAERRSEAGELKMIKDVRQYKNSIIALNALFRKCIENEKIHPIKINYLSERFVMELEQCASIEQIRLVQRKMITAYCRIVREKDGEKHSQLVAKVLAWIDMDLTAELSLRNFAKALNVNASYLSKLFSKEMGMTLTEYVNKRRIQKACRLLENTNLKLESIARQCGFSNAHYFIRQFKKQIKMTPSIYREENVSMDQKEIFRIQEIRK